MQSPLLQINPKRMDLVISKYKPNINSQFPLTSSKDYISVSIVLLVKECGGSGNS